MKNIQVIAAIFAMHCAAPAFAESTYSCQFERVDFGNEKHLDSFRVENRIGGGVLKTYEDLAIIAGCQLTYDKTEQHDIFNCLIGDLKNNTAAMAIVNPGTRRATASYAVGKAVYAVTCNLK